MNTVHRTKFEHAYILDVHFSKSTIDLNVTAASIIPDSHRNLNSVRHAQLTGHTVILEAQAGLLRYGDPELFVPFLKDKSTDLWLLPLLPPPQAHNRVYAIYNLNHHQGTPKEMTTKIQIKACPRQHRPSIFHGI